MAETQRFILVGEADAHVSPDPFQGICGCVTACSAQLGHHVGGGLEVGLDRRFGVAGDDHHMVDAGTRALIDDQLQSWGVDDREQLLGHGLGGREEPRTLTRCRDDRRVNPHG